MVDSVTGGTGFLSSRASIDVFKCQGHFVIHIESVLRLPDETEIRVIHYYVQIRQVMLCSDGQLFDHELEIVVARKCHDSLIRFGAGYTQCCWTCPPQRSG